MVGGAPAGGPDLVPVAEALLGGKLADRSDVLGLWSVLPSDATLGGVLAGKLDTDFVAEVTLEGVLATGLTPPAFEISGTSLAICFADGPRIFSSSGF